MDIITYFTLLLEAIVKSNFIPNMGHMFDIKQSIPSYNHVPSFPVWYNGEIRNSSNTWPEVHYIIKSFLNVVYSTHPPNPI